MILFDYPSWIILPWLFAVGCVVGSFLNVCVHRLPLEDRFWPSLLGIVHPPSRCPKCFNRIPGRFNLPIIGWLLLRGRCYHCQLPISARYPIIEFLNGALFVGVYWMIVPIEFASSLSESCLQTNLAPGSRLFPSPVAADALVHWRYLFHLALFEALFVASLIDIDLKIIPDGCTLPAMFFGFALSTALGFVQLAPVWFQVKTISFELSAVTPDWMAPFWDGPPIPNWITAHPHLHGFIYSLAGAIIGGGVIWALRLIGFWVLKQEAMGFGDVVLMTMIGSFIGWQACLVVFFLAPFMSVIAVFGWIFFGKRETPYGPYLATATAVTVLGWKEIWPYAERVCALGPMLIPMAVVIVTGLYVLLQIVQVIKYLLGIPLYPDEWVEEWTSADQLAHFAGEQVDPHQGQWRPNPQTRWQGESSGRGQTHFDNWRHG
ncbi:MAG: hypothetical protein CMJ78_25550 [Planctomycetaceae bacterium]|nr:hypothetical protein [Planctomycetaceae bacterium]